MSLPQIDQAFLADRKIEHCVSVEAGMICVLLPGFKLPGGYTVAESDLLLRLSAGYPDVPPDMWWFDPPVRRADGAEIACTQVTESHLGRTWQRWSRHLQPGQWRSGIDSIESFIALVRTELVRSSPAPSGGRAP